MLKLYVIRHGKAVKSTRSGKDFDRELNTKGTAQINQTGDLLKRSAVKIDQIVASGARRTFETAEILNYHLNTGKIYYNDTLYLAEREIIEEQVLQQAKGKSVLVVGHNYGITDYVNYLCHENLLLSTGMLVEIMFNFDDWKQITGDTGTISQIIQPNVYAF